MRDRREDIEPLAEHFLAEFAARDGVEAPALAPEVLSLLKAYPWPGNVRQFRNTMERAWALGDGRQVGVEDLPDEVRDPAAVLGEGDLKETFQAMKARKVAAIESTYIEQLLERHDGNVTRAAEDAGMARSALQKLMRRYGIESSRYRDE